MSTMPTKNRLLPHFQAKLLDIINLFEPRAILFFIFFLRRPGSEKANFIAPLLNSKYAPYSGYSSTNMVSVLPREGLATSENEQAAISGAMCPYSELLRAHPLFGRATRTSGY